MVSLLAILTKAGYNDVYVYYFRTLVKPGVVGNVTFAVYIPVKVDFKGLAELSRSELRSGVVIFIKDLFTRFEWAYSVSLDDEIWLRHEDLLEIQFPDQDNENLMKITKHTEGVFEQEYAIQFDFEKQRGRMETMFDYSIDSEKYLAFSIELEQANVKLEIESPRNVSFELSKSELETNHFQWISKVNLDRSSDFVGTAWILDIKTNEQGKDMGVSVGVQGKRGAEEMLSIETGFNRPTRLPIDISTFGFVKMANFDRKIGMKADFRLADQQAKLNTSVISLASELDFDLGIAFSNGIQFDIRHDLGIPAAVLLANFDWRGDHVKGLIQYDKKAVEYQGQINITDQYNYAVVVKVQDNEKNKADFWLNKHWSQSSNNNSLQMKLETNNGHIIWSSHRYVANPIHAGGIIVKYRVNDWAVGEETVLCSFGEIDLATPSLIWKLETPFRTANYRITTERRDHGVVQVTGRLLGDGGRLTVINFEMDPTQPSFDLFSEHPDKSKYKMHGHVVSTQHAFFEAKRMLNGSFNFEKLARMSVDIEQRILNFRVGYFPALGGIVRIWFENRRSEISELINRYSEHVPEGFQSIRKIKLFDEVVMPFIEAPRRDRQVLWQNEKAKLNQLLLQAAHSNASRFMFGNQLQSLLINLTTDLNTTGYSGIIILKPKKKAVMEIWSSIKMFVTDDFLMDWSYLRHLEAAELAESRNTIKSALGDVVSSTGIYLNQVVQRGQMQQWSSCFVKYAEHLQNGTSKLLKREELTLIRHAFVFSAKKLQLLATELKSRTEHFFRRENPKTFPLFDSFKHLIKDSKIYFTTDSVNATVVVPFRELASLRAPSAVGQQLKNILRSVDKVLGNVKEGVQNHGPMPQSTLRRWYGLVQYHKSGEINFLPPLSSHAMLVFAEDSVGIVTFDGLPYSLSKHPASNLLVLMYDRIYQVPRLLLRLSDLAILCLVDGKVVEINPFDGTLKIDKKQTEMPIQYRLARVRKIGAEIQLQVRLGFEVICNTQYKYCRIVIDGIRYNVQAGLLGTYSGDKGDDLLGSNGYLFGKLADFICSWSLGDNDCNFQTNYTVGNIPSYDESPVNTSELTVENDFFDRLNSEATYGFDSTEMGADQNTAERICLEMLAKAKSPMSACFESTDPGAFFSFCRRRAQASDGPVEQACGVLFAYSAHCRQHGVFIRPPRSCVKCHLAGSSFDILNRQVNPQALEIPISASDVVFILNENRKCDHFNLTNQIVSLAKDINNRLLQVGIDDNKFSVVGFGGYGAHKEPHFQTLDNGQIWVEWSRIRLLLGLPDQQIRQSLQSDNALMAINLALYSPWRIGAKRVIVMLSCDKASCNQNGIELDILKAKFDINHIAMHFIGPARLPMIRLSPSSREMDGLLGFDSKTLYTYKTSPIGGSSFSMVSESGVL